MFPEICRQAARAVGESTLIPSSSFIESTRIRLLHVVILKERRRWIGYITVEYEPRLLSLECLLTGQTKLTPRIQTRKYHSYDMKRTWSVAIESKSAGGTRTATDDTKVGELIFQEIYDDCFMEMLKHRKIDMDNLFIKQIKDTKEVLSVVKCVLQTSEKTTITHTENTDGVLEKMYKCVMKYDSSNVMTIYPENTLAFQVCQLTVDENSGEITPVMRKDDSGGFSNKDKEVKESKPQFSLDSSRGFDGEQSRPYDTEVKESKSQSRSDSPCAFGGGYQLSYDKVQEKSKSRSSLVYSAFLGGFSSDVDKSYAYRKGFSTSDLKEMSKALKNLQEILQPLRGCTEAGGQNIKPLLLDLMTCSSHSDVVALSKILPKAENGCLNEDEHTLDKQFINNDTVWSILKCVGVKTKGGRVLHERKDSPLLIAVAYMIDAILEIENDDLDTIYHWDEPQLKTLSNIFESAVTSSMPISMDVDMSSVLTKSVKSFLTGLDFTVSEDDKRILPPKVKTCAAECIFCVLYCLSS